MRSQLHAYGADDPIWGFVALVASERFTGEAELGDEPRLRLFVVDGRVYFAERDTDAPLGARLVELGVLTQDQLERATVHVGNTASLARMFQRDPSIDRDAVELTIEMETESLLESFADHRAGTVAVHPLRLHPSGIHHWLRAVPPRPTVVPVVEAPAVEEPAVEEPAVEEPVAEEAPPSAYEPTVELPVIDEETEAEEPEAEPVAADQTDVQEIEAEQTDVQEIEAEQAEVQEIEAEETQVEAEEIQVEVEQAAEEPVAEDQAADEEPAGEWPVVLSPLAIDQPLAAAPLVVDTDEPSAEQAADEATEPELPALAPLALLSPLPGVAAPEATAAESDDAVGDDETEPETEPWPALQFQPEVEVEVAEIEPEIEHVEPQPEVAEVEVAEVAEVELEPDADTEPEFEPVAEVAEVVESAVAEVEVAEVDVAEQETSVLAPLSSFGSFTPLQPDSAPIEASVLAPDVLEEPVAEEALEDEAVEEPEQPAVPTLPTLAAKMPSLEEIEEARREAKLHVGPQMPQIDETGLPKLASKPLAVGDLPDPATDASADAGAPWGATHNLAAVEIWEMVDDLLTEDQPAQQLVPAGAPQDQKQGRGWLRGKKG